MHAHMGRPSCPDAGNGTYLNPPPSALNPPLHPCTLNPLISGTPTQVTDAGNGTYHVAYKAREGGEYALQVRVTRPA